MKMVKQMETEINNPLYSSKMRDIQNTCFDYKRQAEDVINEYIQSNWEMELNDFKRIYNNQEDFMEQLSQHNLFNLLCMLDLTDDDYMEKCYAIQSELN